MSDKINAIDKKNMMLDKMDEINEHSSTMSITCNCSHSEIAMFQFTQLDIKDPTIPYVNVSDVKMDNHNEKFKTVANLDKHDRKFHITKEPVPKHRCSQYTKISQNKKNLYDHMTTENKICLICEKVFHLKGHWIIIGK